MYKQTSIRTPYNKTYRGYVHEIIKLIKHLTYMSNRRMLIQWVI